MSDKTTDAENEGARERPLNFIQHAVNDDLASGRFSEVVTRFPPEPNGYPHVGHLKAAWINYSLAKEHGGRFHLRFDDTNPSKEEARYVEAIMEDLHWLGIDWGDHLFHASDYFEQLHDWAVQLIEAGKAFVCDLDADAMREHRGTLTAPGRDSPYRDRSVDENLELFARMREGEFPNGARTLRAKIDMASPNLNLRDPTMYRIQHAPTHHRTGDAWCIYPMYDWAHGQSGLDRGDHPLARARLEFENHRPLYEWFVETSSSVHAPASDRVRPARDLTYTMVMSKRKLKRAGRRRAWWGAGTTRACRRSAACGAAATRPPR